MTHFTHKLYETISQLHFIRQYQTTCHISKMFNLDPIHLKFENQNGPGHIQLFRNISNVSGILFDKLNKTSVKLVLEFDSTLKLNYIYPYATVTKVLTLPRISFLYHH